MLEANVNQLESELITAMLEIDRADYKFEMLVRCYFKSIKSPTILSPTSLSPSNNITFVFKTKVNKTFYPNETTKGEIILIDISLGRFTTIKYHWNET